MERKRGGEEGTKRKGGEVDRMRVWGNEERRS